MSKFATKRLADCDTVQAPDGSSVRLLHRMSGGSMAHFSLAAGQVAKAVRHKSIEEIWYFVAGRGRMWRASDRREEFVDVAPDMAITIPPGTSFQFRAQGDEALAAVAVTMPPWPGEEEAEGVEGPWTSTF